VEKVFDSLNVFIASPADVGRERAQLLVVIENINKLISKTINLVLNPVIWENMPFVESGAPESEIQDEINKLVEKSELFVLILGKRYGVILPGHLRSATELEFDHVLHRAQRAHNVALFAYHKELPDNPDPGEQEHWMRSFRKKLWEENIAGGTFTNIDNFIALASRDLYTFVLKYVSEKGEHSSKDETIGIASPKPSNEKRSPRIFISYSHDSNEHMRWVHKLATNCVESGVDVSIDVWDLHYGDDVAEFMERSVAECDRVLIVCTPDYVQKADNLKGGVGFEKTIITGEIIRNIGTNKFIPIIRSSSDQNYLPRALSSRLYIDFREESKFQASLDSLLRELLGNPEFIKPELGSNPYA